MFSPESEQAIDSIGYAGNQFSSCAFEGELHVAKERKKSCISACNLAGGYPVLPLLPGMLCTTGKGELPEV